MATDGFVRVAPDSSGKRIDNTEITRAESAADGTPIVVERQRVDIRDDLRETNSLLTDILKELRALQFTLLAITR